MGRWESACKTTPHKLTKFVGDPVNVSEVHNNTKWQTMVAKIREERADPRVRQQGRKKCCSATLGRLVPPLSPRSHELRGDPIIRTMTMRLLLYQGEEVYTKIATRLTDGYFAYTRVSVFLRLLLVPVG